ncbi:MAG: hypothetical protein WAQ99_05545 [Pyrinomonadaceae bacterium]
MNKSGTESAKSFTGFAVSVFKWAFGYEESESISLCHQRTWSDVDQKSDGGQNNSLIRWR